MSRQVINGAYDIELLPTQKAVIDSIGAMQTPNIMYTGGFGSGKTRLAGEAALQLMSVYDGIQLGTFRKTRTAIKDTTYKTFLNEVLPPEYIARDGWNKTDLEIKLINGSSNHFFGIDNFERKASLQFDVIIVDEATELEEEDHIMLQGRLRGGIVPMPMKIDVCNPGAPGSYLHKLYVDNHEKTEAERDKDFRYFCTTSYENVHNPKAYFDRLRKWIGSQYYDRYVLGLWKAFRGTVYEQYDPKIHLIAPFEIPHNWPKKLAVDFGYDNPLVMLWIATDPGTGIKYIYRQYYHSHVLIKKACEIGRKVTEAAKEILEDINADHDAEGRAQFEEYWQRTTAAEKAVMSGIQAVQERLLERPDGKRGLYIFNDSWSERDGFWYGNIDPDPVLAEENKPKCLQDEFPLYKWGKDDKPVKIADHGLDALRYDEYTEKMHEGGKTDVKIHRQNTFARQ
jgi:phage terminase large subunit